MKRLCLILSVLLLAAPAMAEEPLQLARMSGPMLGAGSGAVACTSGGPTETVIFDSSTATEKVNNQTGSGGQQFITASKYTITRYKMMIADQDYGKHTFTVGLYRDSTNTVGDAVPDSSASLPETSVPDAPTWGLVEFVLAVPLTGLAAGTYWVVASCTQASSLGVAISLPDTDDLYFYYSGTSYENNASVPVIVYGCPE